jgi:hypothetical protein
MSPFLKKWRPFPGNGPSSEGCMARREPNRSLPSKAPYEAEAAHDVWQIDDMDAERYEGGGHVGLLNAKDVFSRVHTACFALP